MKSDNPVKHFAIAFVLAMLVYVIAYSGIEHRRNRKGPWEITFTTGPSHEPALIVNQSRLGITNVHLLFSRQAIPTNIDSAITFRDPRPTPFDVPFGQCIFMDLTFLPGTLTFRMFGHEIELLPRIMILDHEEHRWKSGEVLELRQAEPKLKRN